MISFSRDDDKMLESFQTLFWRRRRLEISLLAAVMGAPTNAAFDDMMRIATLAAPHHYEFDCARCEMPLAAAP